MRFLVALTSCFIAAYTSFYASISGLVSFSAFTNSAASVALPTASVPQPFVASWWADASTLTVLTAISSYSNAVPNNIYIRYAGPSASDIARMRRDVASALPAEPTFNATSLAVVTWFAVGYNAAVDRLNTFQTAIASDNSGALLPPCAMTDLVWDNTTTTTFANGWF